MFFSVEGMFETLFVIVLGAGFGMLVGWTLKIFGIF